MPAMSGRWQRAVLGLLVWLLVCFGAGLFGSRFMPGEWYAQLAKPSWTPPDWLFGPVWTGLYAMMAVAAWLVWKAHGVRKAALPLVVFVVQLVLNAAWTWLFFGLQRPVLAFLDITVMWIAILVTLVLFWRRNPIAGALMLPYLAWVTYAASLNFALWRLNA